MILLFLFSFLKKWSWGKTLRNDNLFTVFKSYQKESDSLSPGGFCSSQRKPWRKRPFRVSGPLAYTPGTEPTHLEAVASTTSRRSLGTPPRTPPALKSKVWCGTWAHRVHLTALRVCRILPHWTQLWVCQEPRCVLEISSHSWLIWRLGKCGSHLLFQGIILNINVRFFRCKKIMFLN